MPTICIDPGHGGKDPGAVNGNYHESDIALAIAKKVNTLLKAQGFKTMMTRTDDSYVDKYVRCRMANDAKADLFASIHINSNDGTPATGIETLIYGAGGNAEKCAKKVQPQLIKDTGAKDRGIKSRPRLVVLNTTDMPAILVELGFINNKDDLAKLKTAAYQTTLATAIVKGICAYYGKEYKVATKTKTNKSKFTDTKGYFAEKDIEEMVELGILAGYGDGKFGPNDPLTRGQAAAICKRLIAYLKK